MLVVGWREEDKEEDDEEEDDDEEVEGINIWGRSVVDKDASRPFVGNANIVNVVSDRILLKQQGQESLKPLVLLRKDLIQAKQNEQLAPDNVQTENCNRAFSLVETGAKGI